MKNAKLFRKGAEASLYRGEWFGRQAIIKVRHPREYRHPNLDYKLRVSRTAREAHIISGAKKAGVRTPLLFEIDFPRTTLIMEYVEGALLRDVVSDMPHETLRRLFFEVGAAVGRLHNQGIIHGDLTTSNMIYMHNNQLCFIDFGLASFSSEVESRGVDLLLAKRTLSSSHPLVFETCFKALTTSYRETIPMGQEVISKIGEIEKRGRYVKRTATNPS
ncbi:MAG: KEOPS complex kinase/ATPase Bud32 [Candidatus Heimdallarchaeota archaeon]